MSRSFHVRRESWPSCSVETSPGIRRRRLEWWRTACTAYTRGRVSWHEGALRLVCNVGAPRRHQRYTVDRSAHGGVRDRASVSLLFVLSSRVPATFLRDSSLGDSHCTAKSRLLFVSWKRGDSVMMGSMQVFVCKIVSRYVSILVSLHCDPWMVYNVVWTRWREFLMCNVKHLG